MLFLCSIALYFQQQLGYIRVRCIAFITDALKAAGCSEAKRAVASAFETSDVILSKNQ